MVRPFRAGNLHRITKWPIARSVREAFLMGAGKWERRRGQVLGFCMAFALLPATAAAQRVNPNERAAPQLNNVEDKDDIRKADGKIWVLDFKFYDPRQITVDIAGRGRKICWYLKYQIINNTNEPRTFVPDFVIVTPDRPGHVYHDQVLPKVQDAIRQV